MQKKNSKANLAVLIIAAIIELTVAVFTLLYVFNTFDLQTKLLPEVLGYITLGVTFLDAILCLILVFAINKVKEKTDIKMSDVVGADIKEAYMFGKIGLVVVNEDGIVLWENDLLLDRQINIISRNIFEWYPKLKDF